MTTRSAPPLLAPERPRESDGSRHDSRQPLQRAIGAIREQHADVRSLACVVVALTGEKTAEGVLRLAAEALVERFDGALALAWTLDETGAALELRATAGDQACRTPEHERIPLRSSRIGRIADSGQAYWSNQVHRDRLMLERARLRANGIVAFGGWPLRGWGQVLGVLAYYSRSPIPESRLAVLGVLAEATAVALHRVQLYEAERRSREWLRVLRDVGLTLAWGGDLDQLLRSVAEHARTLLGTPWSAVLLWEPRAPGLRVRALAGAEAMPLHMVVPPGQGASWQAFQERRTVIVRDYQGFSHASPEARRVGTRAVAAAPLLAGGSALGVLAVATNAVRELVARDVELLELFAQRAAQAIEAARAQEEAQRHLTTQSVLLEEIHHRVRNNLATVLSLIELERHRDPPPPLDESLERLHGRVQGIAAIHSLLSEQAFQEVDFTQVAGELCRSIADAEESGRMVQFHSPRQAVRLDAKRATALALTTNELLTNALKHGIGHVAVFLAERGGLVSLRVRDGDDGPRRPIILRTSPPPSGRGLRLVVRLVERELGGTVRFELGERGALATVKFPRPSIP